MIGEAVLAHIHPVHLEHEIAGEDEVKTTLTLLDSHRLVPVHNLRIEKKKVYSNTPIEHLTRKRVETTQ